MWQSFGNSLTRGFFYQCTQWNVHFHKKLLQWKCSLFVFDWLTHHYYSGVIGGCEVGFQCPNNLNWCLPMRNVCNKVNNCPDGADEQSCNEKHPTSNRISRLTTPQSVTTILYAQKSTCPSWLHDCGDGRCVLFENDCKLRFDLFRKILNVYIWFWNIALTDFCSPSWKLNWFFVCHKFWVKCTNVQRNKEVWYKKYYYYN